MNSELVTLWGAVLPEGILHEHWFQLLAAFVSVNTLIYVTLAVAKSLPRIYPGDFLPRRYARGETRSIHPDGPR